MAKRDTEWGILNIKTRRGREMGGGGGWGGARDKRTDKENHRFTDRHEKEYCHEEKKPKYKEVQ